MHYPRETILYLLGGAVLVCMFVLVWSSLQPQREACQRAGAGWTTVKGVFSLRVVCIDDAGRMFVPPAN
ncbi:hypothetical protein [Ancylobacter sp. IITR112]|uniref:hypothetical protein n=1 Tax=Ancylobacter sp. IITR112 TaxID=3138073 RepID=UPI00352A01A6